MLEILYDSFIHLSTMFIVRFSYGFYDMFFFFVIFTDVFWLLLLVLLLTFTDIRGKLHV